MSINAQVCKERQQYVALTLLVISCSLWGSAFVFIRMLVKTFTPGALALYRFLIASVIMLVFYQKKDFIKPVLVKDKLRLMFVGSIGIGVYNTFLNKGEVLVSASIASFIIGLIPVVTILFSLIVLKEKIDKRTVMGLGIALIGLCLLLHDSNRDGSILGEGFIIIAMFAGGFYNVLQKKFLSSYHPLQTTAWLVWGGTLSLCVFSQELYINIPQATWAQHLGAWYLGIFPATIAYLCWSYVNQILPVSNAAMYLYTIPFFSTTLGYFFLNELPSVFQIGNASLALVGAYISNRRT